MCTQQGLGTPRPACPLRLLPGWAWAGRPCSVPKPSFSSARTSPLAGRSVRSREICVRGSSTAGLGAGPSLRAVRALSGEAGCCRTLGCGERVRAVPAAGLPDDGTEAQSQRHRLPGHLLTQGDSTQGPRPGRAGSGRGACIWAREGLVDSRSAHGRPAGPFSFPVTVQRAAVAGAERRPRARTVCAPGFSGRLPGPRTRLTVGPSWARLQPSCTNCCSTQQRARLPRRQGGLTRGSARRPAAGPRKEDSPSAQEAAMSLPATA